jgi:hypothetical protein
MKDAAANKTAAGIRFTLFITTFPCRSIRTAAMKRVNAA